MTYPALDNVGLCVCRYDSRKHLMPYAMSPETPQRCWRSLQRSVQQCRRYFARHQRSVHENLMHKF